MPQSPVLQFILFWKFSCCLFFSRPNLVLASPSRFFPLQSFSLFPLFSQSLAVEAAQTRPVPGITSSSTVSERLMGNRKGASWLKQLRILKDPDEPWSCMTRLLKHSHLAFLKPAVLSQEKLLLKMSSNIKGSAGFSN